MAEDINTNSENQNGNEEEPIIVAQRFLNIFRQMHLLTPERKASFDKMLTELPPDIRNLLKTLPGGAPLQEYIDVLEHKTSSSHAKKGNSSGNTILQNALTAGAPAVAPAAGAIMDSGNFAKILANSLAQSNAQIIKELQSNIPSSSGSGQTAPTAGHPLKLVADESFTKIISAALAEAIANSEQKRLEDNRAIANSFLELQENLSKMMEQNAQLKYISSGEAPADAVAGFQFKNIVDDLVKAQSKFLQETTQNQKEELSSIIATAIKESQKLSTQSLIDSFRKIGEENGPTPITYAAAAPSASTSLESVEQAIKAQGKEFSSIISTAIKESQKNSTQTIIETLEELKKGNHINSGSKEALPSFQVEEIMKMQADLFRDIAKTQNQEFSALISNALKESQKQSTLAIISALRQLSLPQAPQTYNSYGNYPQSAVWPDPAYNQPQPVPPPAPSENTAPIMLVEEEPEVSFPVEEETFLPATEEADTDTNFELDTVLSEDSSEILTAGGEEAPKKKKKKKKKKNKNGENAISAESDNIPESVPDDILPEPADIQPVLSPAPTIPVAEQRPAAAPVLPQPAAAAPVQTVAQLVEKAPKPEIPQPTPQPQPRKLTMPDTIPSLPEISDIVDTEDTSGDDWGWGTSNSMPQDDDKPQYNEWQSPKKEFIRENMPETTEYAATEEDNWEWEYEDASAEVDGVEGEDWEWEYEEVPADEAGAEGEDWEWEYEEVPADEAGAEGEDWEWEYEEDEAPASESLSPAEEEAPVVEEIVSSSEIIAPEPLNIILMGIDNNGFQDPYIEETEGAAV